MDIIFRKLGWSAGSRRQQGERSTSTSGGSNMDTASPRPLTYHLLEEITNGFSENRKLGTGAYGSVYKGEYKDGEKIAVKMLHDVLALDNEQFEKEYFNLANLQHKNVVRLVGYCHETRRECVPYKGKMVFADMTKRALCFEYMHNGGLDKCLSDETSGHDWCTRYSIIKGICEGLKYLHEELESPMYHLDLKPANVLLDERMMPKIADFGLSRFFAGELTKITKSAIGTHGYVPPEYIDASVISIKFDIFSLGVLIIKIITGPAGYFRSAEMSAKQFIELVLANWRKRLDATSVYPLELYSEQVKRCIEIALSCLEVDRSKRPSIGEIVNKLNETETVIQNMLRRDTGSSVDQSALLPGFSDLCMTVKSGSSTGKGRSKLSSNKVTYGFHLVEGESQSHEMEDYHVAEFKYEENHELGLFAIFDGHWGDRVPSYLSANLFYNILQEPLFWTDPQESIKNAYGCTNKLILEHVQQLGPGGSTAVTAIVYDGKDMWIANVGDSRAVLCERGAANQVTVDHEPHATKERQRIEQHGGSVTIIPGDVPRVNGQLAVSRAFGHNSLKTHLSSEPDLRHVPINSSIEFVILASDGLWKVMRNQEAVDLVRSSKDPQAAAKQLTKEAVARNSKDDISCIVIRFQC